jgi:hypothetical protein
MNTKPTQRELEEFVSREIGICQSSLIDMLLNKNQDNGGLDGFDDEHITNYDKTREQLIDEGYTDKQINDADIDNGYQEIFEWWTIGEWMKDQLLEQGEPILENDYGTWWGRCTTGQSISIDNVIEAIYTKLHNN